MTLPPDLAGFLAVILRGALLSGQALVVGGVAFILALARPLMPHLGPPGPILLERCLVWLSRSGLLLLAMAGLSLGLALWDMTSTLSLPLANAIGAEFIRWVAASALAGLLTWGLARTALVRWTAWPLLGAVLLAQAASIMSGHAAARLDHQALSVLAVLLHQLGASVWIGGIPYLLLALRHLDRREARYLVGLRFSHMAMLAVALLLAGAGLLTWEFIGSARAAIGTAYGAMALTKGVLLAVLLVIGLANALFVRSAAPEGADGRLGGLPRLAEVEIGIGFSILFIAASLASQPPAADQLQDIATVPSLAEISARMVPRPPRLTSPDPGQLTAYGTEATSASAKGDEAWSEFNHNWAGLFVIAIALLCLVERSGKLPAARHWPLMFVALAAWLLVRSDPESWPVGPVGFFEVMRDPEVLQHRLVILLIVPFGFFEWAVRTGRLENRRAAFVFPLFCAIGGLLLLAHSHSLSDVKQRLLIELTHLPMGALGLLAGWSRWLELRSEGRLARLASWIWPVCFLLVGLLLVNYRES